MSARSRDDAIWMMPVPGAPFLHHFRFLEHSGFLPPGACSGCLLGFLPSISG